MCSIRCSLRTLALALAFLAASATCARADQPARGKAHLQRGLQLYRDGQYQASIAEFESGYAVLPKPAFLLNIAQAYRKLNQLERARSYYQRFALRTPLNDPARAQALAIIDKIDAQLRAEAVPTTSAPSAATQPPVVTPPATPNPTPPATTASPPAVTSVPPVVTPAPIVETTPPGRSRAPGWAGVALVAAGGAALAAGLGLTLEAVHLDDQYRHPVDGTPFDPSLVDRRDLYRNVGVGFLAGGGALVVVGVALAARYLPQSHAVRVGWAPRLEVRF